MVLHPWKTRPESNTNTLDISMKPSRLYWPPDIFDAGWVSMSRFNNRIWRIGQHLFMVVLFYAANKWIWFSIHHTWYSQTCPQRPHLVETKGGRCGQVAAVKVIQFGWKSIKLEFVQTTFNSPKNTIFRYAIEYWIEIIDNCWPDIIAKLELDGNICWTIDQKSLKNEWKNTFVAAPGSQYLTLVENMLAAGCGKQVTALWKSNYIRNTIGCDLKWLLWPGGRSEEVVLRTGWTVIVL